MEETRAAKYGRYLSMWIRQTIDSVPEEQRNNYRESLVTELRTYSFEPRKKGTPKNSGCIRELIDMAEMDVRDPVHLARLVKEGVHLMYQKGTASRVMRSLLDNL